MPASPTLAPQGQDTEQTLTGEFLVWPLDQWVETSHVQLELLTNHSGSRTTNDCTCTSGFLTCIATDPSGTRAGTFSIRGRLPFGSRTHLGFLCRLWFSVPQAVHLTRASPRFHSSDGGRLLTLPTQAPGRPMVKPFSAPLYLPGHQPQHHLHCPRAPSRGQPLTWKRMKMRSSS